MAKVTKKAAPSSKKNLKPAPAAIKAESKKGGKAAAKAEKAAPAVAAAAPGAEGEAAVDPDELEEQQDAAAAAGANAGGNAAALAAASGTTEMSASFKNFRHHPDMENFYRFIYDNDLRHEALAIIDQIMIEKQARRALKGAKAQAH
jgi:hypothetical protein